MSYDKLLYEAYGYIVEASTESRLAKLVVRANMYPADERLLYEVYRLAGRAGKSVYIAFTGKTARRWIKHLRRLYRIINAGAIPASADFYSLDSERGLDPEDPTGKIGFELQLTTSHFTFSSGEWYTISEIANLNPIISVMSRSERPSS